jgi:hypothetical protein
MTFKVGGILLKSQPASSTWFICVWYVLVQSTPLMILTGLADFKTPVYVAEVISFGAVVRVRAGHVALRYSKQITGIQISALHIYNIKHGRPTAAPHHAVLLCFHPRSFIPQRSATAWLHLLPLRLSLAQTKCSHPLLPIAFYACVVSPLHGMV